MGKSRAQIIREEAERRRKEMEAQKRIEQKRLADQQKAAQPKTKRMGRKKKPVTTREADPFTALLSGEIRPITSESTLSNDDAYNMQYIIPFIQAYELIKTGDMSDRLNWVEFFRKSFNLAVTKGTAVYMSGIDLKEGRSIISPDVTLGKVIKHYITDGSRTFNEKASYLPIDIISFEYIRDDLNKRFGSTGDLTDSGLISHLTGGAVHEKSIYVRHLRRVEDPDPKPLTVDRLTREHSLYMLTNKATFGDLGNQLMHYLTNVCELTEEEIRKRGLWFKTTDDEDNEAIDLAILGDAYHFCYINHLGTHYKIWDTAE